MNIFVLDTSPVAAALMQCDKHVVKMVLESAQMLSTICNGPYKATHANHPCTLWAKASTGNYRWLHAHAVALAGEYSARYGKYHKSERVIHDLSQPPADVPEGPLTPFAQCMPEEFKQSCPVQAYRDYYWTKRAFAEWRKNRPAPNWWHGKLMLAQNAEGVEA